MLKIHPIKNFSKIENKIVSKNKSIVKQQGSNLLRASLIALSILGASTINSCTKDLEPERMRKMRQIDTTEVQNDTIKDDENNGFNIIIDDSLDVKEHVIVLTF